MSTAIRRALYGRLAGDSDLRALLGPPAAGFAQSIYFEQAPEDASFPFVVFSKSSGVPTVALPFGQMNVTAIEQSEVWLFKAIDNDPNAVEAIAAQLDARLTNNTLGSAIADGSGTAMQLYRESDVQYTEVANGVAYEHCGGLYRLIIEPDST